jgi:ribosome-associated translation inhibitor RaiA
MFVQVVTDNHITGRETLVERIEASVVDALRRFAPQITSVQVHLADENSHKKGDNDKTCILEARLSGLQPVAARQNAGDVDQAVDGALDKLVALLDHKLGRLHDRKGRGSMSGDGQAEEE